MLIGTILAVLLLAVLGATWSAYGDLRKRDAVPPTLTPPEVPGGVWPPPPRQDGDS